LHRRATGDGKPGKTGVGKNRLVPGASSSIKRLVPDQQIPSGTECPLRLRQSPDVRLQSDPRPAPPKNAFARRERPCTGPISTLPAHMVEAGALAALRARAATHAMKRLVAARAPPLGPHSPPQQETPGRHRAPRGLQLGGGGFDVLGFAPARADTSASAVGLVLCGGITDGARPNGPRFIRCWSNVRT